MSMNGTIKRLVKGAHLAARKGGDLWYTSDKLETLEYLETFRAERLTAVQQHDGRTRSRERSVLPV